jgi:hypothetical protein
MAASYTRTWSPSFAGRRIATARAPADQIRVVVLRWPARPKESARTRRRHSAPIDGILRLVRTTGVVVPALFLLHSDGIAR